MFPIEINAPSVSICISHVPENTKDAKDKHIEIEYSDYYWSKVVVRFSLF